MSLTDRLIQPLLLDKHLLRKKSSKPPKKSLGNAEEIVVNARQHEAQKSQLENSSSLCVLEQPM